MCAKAVKGPSLARSVPKPLKGPSLARSVPKPLKVPSLARSVPKAFKMEQEGEGAKRHYFVPRDSLTLRCRPPTPLVEITGVYYFQVRVKTLYHILYFSPLR